MRFTILRKKKKASQQTFREDPIPTWNAPAASTFGVPKSSSPYVSPPITSSAWRPYFNLSMGWCRSEASVAGRSQSRRMFLSLLTARQRHCFQFLGRYTLKGSRGTRYKIQLNLNSSHQWFYIHKPPTERYYFSLVTDKDHGKSRQDDIYRNLTAIHMGLATDERAALETANWEWYDDKIAWQNKQRPCPPKVTYLRKQQPGKPWKYRDYFHSYLDSYFG